MNKRYFSLFSLAIAFPLLLSSCLITKSYKSPVVDFTDDLFRTDKLVDSFALEMDSTTLAQVSWQNLFSDELLKDYIETALYKNQDVRIALQNIKAASAYVKQARASFAPGIDANAKYSGGVVPSTAQPGVSWMQQGFNIGANLSWEADIWGKIQSQKNAASATYLQTLEAHKAIKTNLVANVASLYYQLAAISDQIVVAQNAIATRDSSLNTIKSLKAAGMVTEVAVKQTESQLYDAQLLLINLKQQERVLENTFCLILGEEPHPVNRNSLSQQTITTKPSIGVPAFLLAYRPDVRSAEYAFMNAFELTNVARANFYPSFSITANGGFQSAQIKDWFSLSSLFSNFAGNLLQPIFNKRQIRTAHEVALTQQEIAYLNYEKALLRAGNEVSNALFNIQTQGQTIELETKQYQALSKAVDYSEQLLLNGLANYLEVLTARQNVLMTEIGLVNARYAQLNSVVELYQALGGGWR